ncbi:hypothetical protein [Frigoriglobus tundricola]|uniref:Uncharacterized protein n=1 Tax=Frigoriglobus tundricola TaxID=2774151 RepID=A0A6M5YV12_9BACT|nr:hypothetical protein [Frigoriglobus tundricola]QJW97290.1 hypothetical protein FTUN_4860 [Frigoriglobus tundricola]
MNTLTRAPAAAESNVAPPVPTAARKDCSGASDDQLRALEADRVFEARVQWFLAVSRNA